MGMGKKLKIKITSDTSGGEIICYHLMLSHGENHFSGLIVYDADQMRRIAAALIAKASEIEKRLCDWCNEPVVESPCAIKAYLTISEFPIYHTKCFVIAHQAQLSEKDHIGFADCILKNTWDGKRS